MLNFILISVALLLDSLLGEPGWLWSRVPHPVRIMGIFIAKFDVAFNAAGLRRAKGTAVLVGLLIGFTGVAWGLSWVPDGGVLEVLGAAILLGHRSLVQHVAAVGAALGQGLPEGRCAVSMIVGRDVAALDESAVSRAAIESAAENFSDGVVAPVFWFLLAGLPGIVAYKLVNTADSMIGHRSDKYLEFGWAAARLDDVMNYIPARISAGLIAMATGSAEALKVVRADAGQHRSPNAGWPEGAMAGALGVALSGPRVYDGKLTDDLFVNAAGRKDLGPEDIARAVKVLWRAWALMLVGVALAGGLYVW
ncbi:MAG: cobalamin biosynthesis protein [Rhodobacteraceae bacterium]|nr:cobalamin biosynthesis protein [Paracoccaceae bacterium]